MRTACVALGVLLSSCNCGVAQKPPEKGLVELLADMPAVAHKNRLDLPMYGVQIEEAYKRDPSALEAATPMFAKDLSNAEPGAQLETAVLIEVLAMDANNLRFVLRFSDQLAELIVSGDEYTSAAAMAAFEQLGEATPDIVVRALLTRLNDKDTPGRPLGTAVSILLLARPNDAYVEGTVLSAIKDPTRSKEQRRLLLDGTGGASVLVGQAIVDYVVSVVKTSQDIPLRNSAVNAAQRMGLRALNPILAKLHAIKNDPKELPESREAATQALFMQAHTVR